MCLDNYHLSAFVLHSCFYSKTFEIEIDLSESIRKLKLIFKEKAKIESLDQVKLVCINCLFLSQYGSLLVLSIITDMGW